MQTAYCPAVDMPQHRQSSTSTKRSARLDLLDMECISGRRSPKAAPIRQPKASVNMPLPRKPLKRLIRQITPKVSPNADLHERYLQSKSVSRVISIAHAPKQIQQQCAKVFGQAKVSGWMGEFAIARAWLDEICNWPQPGHIRIIVEFENNRNVLERLALLDQHLSTEIVKATGQFVRYGVHLSATGSRVEPLPMGFQLV